MRKKENTFREKTLPTLCQNRELFLKFTRISLFIKAYSYFFKSKWGFSFNPARDQANGSRIKSSTFDYSFNLETSHHDSRSSFIAPLDHNVSWRSNQRNLLYSFIVKIHTENCTQTHIYKSNTSWLFVTLFRDRVILLLRKLCVQIDLRERRAVRTNLELFCCFLKGGERERERERERNLWWQRRKREGEH